MRRNYQRKDERSRYFGQPGWEDEFEHWPAYSAGRSCNWKYWNEPYEGLGGRGWYEGLGDAMHQGEGEHVGRGPRGYKRSDERIEDEINEWLTRHGMIDATDIEVAVRDGEVTLRGHVDSREAKRLAEDIADSVFGVKDVSNQIRIKRRDAQQPGRLKDPGQQKKAS